MQRKALPWIGVATGLIAAFLQPSSSPAAASGRQQNSPRLKSRSRTPIGKEAIFLIAASSFFVGLARQTMHLKVQEWWKGNTVGREASLLAYRHPSFQRLWFPLTFL